jgi:hypothetical protein
MVSVYWCYGEAYEDCTRLYRRRRFYAKYFNKQFCRSELLLVDGARAGTPKSGEKTVDQPLSRGINQDPPKIWALSQ